MKLIKITTLYVSCAILALTLSCCTKPDPNQGRTVDSTESQYHFDRNRVEDQTDSLGRDSITNDTTQQRP